MADQITGAILVIPENRDDLDDGVVFVERKVKNDATHGREGSGQKNNTTERRQILPPL